MWGVPRATAGPGLQLLVDRLRPTMRAPYCVVTALAGTAAAVPCEVLQPAPGHCVSASIPCDGLSTMLVATMVTSLPALTEPTSLQKILDGVKGGWRTSPGDRALARTRIGCDMCGARCRRGVHSSSVATRRLRFTAWSPRRS